MSENNNNILEVKGVSVSFNTEEGQARAVQNVSFNIKKGKTFALVGESGSGKSVTALSIMGLVPMPPGRILQGEIFFQGQDLLKYSDKKMRTIRGNKIAMIFQEPMTSLNPVYTVGYQIVEAIQQHQNIGTETAWSKVVEMLGKVGIPDAEERVDQYPHEMSGGMRQRVMIAMAASCEPELLIADEPTTALDVTTQAQILNLLDDIQKQENMSILLITHDLGVVAERADEIGVMYASRIAEKASAEEIFTEPMHPYTRGLLKSLPKLGIKEKRLSTIPGTVPNPVEFPTGCKFHPRCPLGHNDLRCRSEEPELREVSENRYVACWYAEGYETQEERKEYERKYGKRPELSIKGK